MMSVHLVSVALLCLTLFEVCSTASADSTDEYGHACPTWFRPVNGNVSKRLERCECGSSLEDLGEMPIIMCHETTKQVALHLGYCMTYNDSTPDTEAVVATCPYSYPRVNITGLYMYLPSNASELNNFTCGELNREGILCQQCQDGFGPAMYAISWECRPCKGLDYGSLALYLFLELFPITVLFFLVVVFEISATVPPLGTLVFLCQGVVLAIRSDSFINTTMLSYVDTFSSVCLRLLLVLSGVWNLDFFRFIIPSFCIDSDFSNVQLLLLEYIGAFYSLFLVVVTFTCIKLHHCNFRPVVILWKPFHKCFACIRRTWNPKASVVSAFATFLLLSYAKLLLVSVNLSFYTSSISDMFGKTVSNCVMFYATEVQCSGKFHLLYVLVSWAVILAFVLLPTFILILYPTRLFRKCVTCCGQEHCRSQHAFRTFVEKFQGHYKDGTSSSYDFRQISALYFFLRIAFTVGYSGPTDPSGWLLVTVVFTSVALFIAMVRPYKKTSHNILDSLLMAVIGFMTLLCMYISSVGGSHTLVLLLILLSLIPHAIVYSYITFELAKRMKLVNYLKTNCCSWLQILRKNASPQNEATARSESLPDRLVNQGQYERLLSHTATELEDTAEHFGEKSMRIHPLHVYRYGST